MGEQKPYFRLKLVLEGVGTAGLFEMVQYFGCQPTVVFSDSIHSAKSPSQFTAPFRIPVGGLARLSIALGRKLV